MDRLLVQMYQHLTPGGYVEIAEIQHDLQSDDGSYNKDTALWTYADAYKTSLSKAGFNVCILLILSSLIFGADDTRRYR